MSSLQNYVRLVHRQAPNFQKAISFFIDPASSQEISLGSASHRSVDSSRRFSYCSIAGALLDRIISTPPLQEPEECRALLATGRALPSPAVAVVGKQRLLISASSFVLGVASTPLVPRPYSSDSSVSSVNPSGKIKIYTRTGDKGESSLYDGQRRRKDDPTFEALGDVDELNSALGLAHAYCAQAQLSTIRQQIEEIQSRLLDVGSAVATPLNSLSSKKVARVKFNVGTVGVLEKWIDKMDDELPQLTSFILPSGGLPASSLHVARSICRRAERKVVALVEEEVVDRSVAQYLNRLSDYLFTAARYAALKLQKPETVWIMNKR